MWEERFYNWKSMSRKIQTKRLTRKVKFYAIASLLVISLAIAFVSTVPLYRYAQKTRNETNDAIRDSAALIVTSYLENIKNIARQISSRSKAKQLTLKFINNSSPTKDSDITLKDILASALNSNEYITSIIRLTPKNKQIAQVGEKLNLSILPNVKNHRMLSAYGPIKIDKNHNIIMINSPITHDDGRYLGYDLILFNLNSLSENLIKNFYQHVSELMIVQQSTLGTLTPISGRNYLLSDHSNLIQNEIFIKKLMTMKALQPAGHFEVNIKMGSFSIFYQTIPELKWLVLTAYKHNSLFAALDEYAYYSILMIIILLAISSVILNKILTPLTNQLNRNTNQLISEVEATKNDLQQKNAELRADIDKRNLLIKLDQQVLTERKIDKFSQIILEFINKEFNTPISIFYIVRSDKSVDFIASNGIFYNEKHTQRGGSFDVFDRVIQNKEVLMLENIPDSFFKIKMGFGESKPSNIYIYPIINLDSVIGIVEIGLFKTLTANQNDLISELLQRVGFFLSNILSNQRLIELLEKTQLQASVLKSKEQELMTSEKNAVEAYQAKSQFLSNMSHEIRTPMNAILGFSQILLKSPLNDIQAKYINQVIQSTKSLLLVIDDILDLGKLEKDKMAFEAIPFDLHNLCHEVMHIFEIEVKNKSLELSLEYEPTLTHNFIGDPNRLRQVLLNLVGNAIKFTEEGEIKIIIRSANQPGEIYFGISDTGIGIAQDKLADIFTPFNQTDLSISRKYGGTGLGTSISQQIVEKMHGKIWVTSQLDIGSIFHIELPLKPTQSNALDANVPKLTQLQKNEPIEVSHSPPVASSMSKRILLVEDISINAELASIQLAQRGFSVSTAANGKEALRQLQLSPAFNIILMDIQMPIMDGLEATKKIRHIEREKGNNQHLPIIGVSASVMPEEQKAAYNAGMDAFIGKPIDFDMLAQQISELLDEPITAPKPHVPTTASDPVAIHSPQSTDNLVNFHQGLDNWSSKEKYFNSLKLFVNHYQDAPEQIHALLDKGETKEAKRVVHNLKGVSAHLGLTQLNADVTETDQQIYSKTNLLSINLEKLTESLKRTIEAINTFIQKQKK